jgi:uncharacterized cupin superfamily protein
MTDQTRPTQEQQDAAAQLRAALRRCAEAGLWVGGSSGAGGADAAAWAIDEEQDDQPAFGLWLEEKGNEDHRDARGVLFPDSEDGSVEVDEDGWPIDG